MEADDAVPGGKEEGDSDQEIPAAPGEEGGESERRRRRSSTGGENGRGKGGRGGGRGRYSWSSSSGLRGMLGGFTLEQRSTPPNKAWKFVEIPSQRCPYPRRKHGHQPPQQQQQTQQGTLQQQTSTSVLTSSQPLQPKPQQRKGEMGVGLADDVVFRGRTHTPIADTSRSDSSSKSSSFDESVALNAHASFTSTFTSTATAPSRTTPNATTTSLFSTPSASAAPSPLWPLYGSLRPGDGSTHTNQSPPGFVHRNHILEQQKSFITREQRPCPHPQNHHFGEEEEEEEEAEEERGRAVLWNEGAHLTSFATTLQKLTLYRDTNWSLVPLHPAAVHPESLYYLTSTKTGREEISCLSLNVHIVLCFGALLTDDYAGAAEHFNIARHHASYLLDYTDYSVAQAFNQLGYWLLCVEGDTEHCDYYFTIAVSMCRTLGAFNSSAYIRSLYGFFLNPSSTATDLQPLRQEVQRISDYPCFSVPFGHLTAFLDPKKPVSAVTLPTDSALILQKLHETHSFSQVILEVFSALILADKSEVMIPTSSLLPFLNIIEQCEHELQRSTISVTARFHLRYLLTAMTAHLHWKLGDKETALKSAIAFLEITQQPKWRWAIAGFPATIYWILDIFYSSQKNDLLALQLYFIDVTAGRFQTVAKLRRMYYELLMARMESADLTCSSSSHHQPSPQHNHQQPPLQQRITTMEEEETQGPVT